MGHQKLFLELRKLPIYLVSLANKNAQSQINIRFEIINADSNPIQKIEILNGFVLILHITA